MRKQRIESNIILAYILFELYPYLFLWQGFVGLFSTGVYSHVWEYGIVFYDKKNQYPVG